MVRTVCLVLLVLFEDYVAVTDLLNLEKTVIAINYPYRYFN